MRSAPPHSFRLTALLFTALLVLTASSCSGSGDCCAAEDRVAEVWLTIGNGSVRLEQQASRPFVSAGEATGNLTITIDPARTHQTMEGFGAALTNSSAFLIHNHPQRQAILETLFSPTDGIGISYVRVPLGASDFTAEPPRGYTYNDLPAGATDPDLSEFSIAPAEAFILPVLRDALALNPDLRIMATPWSAPGWMKTNDALNGGQIRNDALEPFAKYLIQALEAYEAAGVPIAAVTLQNEPLHQASNYPTMGMSAFQQATLIAEHFGPMLAASAVDAELLAYDHNWDRPDYPLAVLNNAAANAFVDGVAWHCYAGDVSAQSQVHNAHPDKGTYFTECSGGGWSTDYGNNLSWNMRNLFIGGARNWAKAVLLWNLALDERNGPFIGGCTNCRGVLTLSDDGFTREVEYESIGHFSRFVEPGAVRLSTTQGGDLLAVAFRNPDGTIVLVAHNTSGSGVAFDVQVGEEVLAYSLPAGSLATLRWSE